MLPISSLIQSDADVWTVTPEHTVFEALKILAEKNIGVVPVVASGKLVGIFSERDYARRVILMGRRSMETKIAEVMTKDVKTVSPDDGIEVCMKIVVEHGFRHLPIVSDGELVGVVSANDLLAEVIRTQESEIGTLIDFIGAGGTQY